MKNTIYYFSGTGNSLYLSKKLAERLKDFEVKSIKNAVQNNDYVCNCEKIGIIFPVYCLGIPEIVERFIENIHIENNPYIFCIANYGGEYGGAYFQLSELLNKKGKILSANFGIKMPDNYVVLLNSPKKHNIEKILDNADIMIEKVAKSIDASENNNFGMQLFKKIGYKVIYPFWKRNLSKFDKSFKVSKNCNLCGTCKLVCPVRNIDIKDGHIIWKHGCQDCMACIQICNKKAISRWLSKYNRQYFNPRISTAEYMRGDIK
ncbi:4Fe-4S ferredoxin iron-sulfur binding domain protein [Methanococcus vannielii SB]|uniref:4Fe-4S ferredoxin iron-sulfur binding domain protein n=1 Tax=Methanococcus vannielii (strain ATCC 35089 / DSM 1224 / JCM 13029 / OCM 148 / SB) TaxID=406327 RepID=A6URR9_METVS|nr:EFR1 family ferrodoxin [Methanococcus vannielii]ABR55191.1 4Fe-4S ferredoxin iron-sulfur binding domain protein [Methanococcus vannielii SB]